MSQNNKNNNKGGKLFSFFSPSSNKNGQGLTKKQARFDGKYNFYNFFSFMKFRFGDMTVLNLIFILTNFALVLVLFATSGNTNTESTTPASYIYQQIYGVIQYDSASPSVMTMQSVYGVSTPLSVWTTVTKILYYSAFLLPITFSLSNIGMAYVNRGFIRRDYVTVWHDYWYAIKRDWKQGIVVGLIDCGIIYLLYNAIVFYSANKADYMMYVFFFFSVFFALLYFVMRMYLFTMVVTFDLKIRKMFKNALLFSLLGIKRNICAVLGIAVTLFVSVELVLIFTSVGMILPFLYTISLLYLISMYCTYPVIHKYMIKPMEDQNKKQEPPHDNDEPVFIDRG